MKKLLTMGFVALSLLAAGCEGPIPVYQDPNAPLQVSVSGYGFQDKIRATVLPPERFGAGQLRVTLQVFNRTDRDLSVDYNYWFTDKAGRQLEEPLTRGEVIPPNGYKALVLESRSPVDDFRVQLRPGR